MSDSSDVQRIDRLQHLTGDHMVDVAYTYKAFFKMSRYATLAGWTFDLVVVVGTGLLTVSLVRQLLPLEVNVVIASLTAVMSFLGLFLGFDDDASTFERTGDAYNTLYKEFREYFHLVLTDDDLPIDEKQRRLEELIRRHRDLNELTPATWDWAFNRLDEEDVLGNIEVTEEEHRRLFGEAVDVDEPVSVGERETAPDAQESQEPIIR